MLRLAARRGGLLVLSVVISCQAATELGSPLPPESAGLLIVAPGELGSPRVEAIEAGSALPPVTLREGERLVLLELAGDLASRGLAPGEVPLAETTGRPLPAAASMHGLTAPAAAWSRLDAPPPEIAELRLPELADCACRRFFEDRLVCELPCPAPSAPLAPEAPLPPRVPPLDCPAGWGSTASGLCAPPTRVSSCPLGQYQPLSAAACEPLIACPAGGARFRVPPGAEAASFVDASAAPGGDGSRDRPYASLGDALSAGARVLSLAAGRYPAPSLLPDGARIIGACPDASELLGPLAVAEGAAARVEGVAVRSSSDGVRLRGRLELEAVHLVAGLDGVELEPGAELDALRVRIEGRRWGVRAFSGDTPGRLRLVESEISASRLHALRIEGALVTLEEVAVLPEAGGALRAAGDAVMNATELWIDSPSRSPALDLVDQAALTGARAHARAASFARLDDDAVLLVRGGSLDGDAALVAAETRARVELTSFTAAVREASSAVVLLGESALEASGLDVRGVDADAFLIGRDRASVRLTDTRALGFPVALRMTGVGRLTLERVDLEGAVALGYTDGDEIYRSYPGGPAPCIVRGATSEPSLIEAQIDDLRVRAGSSGAALALCPGTTASGRRLHLEGGAAGLYADCRGRCVGPELSATVDLADVLVDGEGETGVLQRGGRLTLERARVTGRGLYGLYVWGSQATASSLVVEETRDARTPAGSRELEIFCSENRAMTLRAPASAVFVEAWSSPQTLVRADVELERFDLRGAGCAGISMGVDGSFVARRGVIREGFRGLNFVRISEPTIGPEVVFRDNAVDVFRISRSP